MFGINTFGQSSSSPFGSPSVFGQTNNASNNPFAPKPFGSTGCFSSQTGSSTFGGTSTGVFGAQPPSPLGSTSVFGAPSSSAFGSSTPAFGASGTSAFGNTAPAVGGSSTAFGAFGSTAAQTSPSGGSFQQSQPAFGSGLFGSATPFGAQSQPAFGALSSPAFSASSTLSFGSTSTSAFGATPSPSFGGTSTPAFGATSTAFGVTSTPAFGFGSSNPAFGQTASAFGSSPFRTSSSFGTQSSIFGQQTTSPSLGGASPFGGQQGGSRVAPYSLTPETDVGTGTQPAGKLESLSAMPMYKDKSHEELRWEDYQLGDKGGPAPASQSSSTSTTLVNPFSSFTSTNQFAPKTSVFSTVPGSTSASSFISSPFATLTNPTPFGPTPSSTPSSFGPLTSPSIISSSTTSTFGPPSIFAPSSSQATTTTLRGVSGFGSTQSSPLFQSTMPTLTQTSSSFAQTSSPLVQNTTPGFSQPNFFSTSSTGTGGNMFSTPSLSNFSSPGFSQTTSSLTTPWQSAQPIQSNGGFSFNNTSLSLNSSLTTPLQSVHATQSTGGFSTVLSLNSSLTTPLQSAQPTQNAFSLNTVGQSQPGLATQSGITPGIVGNAVIAQPSGTQSSVWPQPAQITNPFGNTPAMPQISINFHGTSPSVQYGISSLPVVEEPTPPRISPLLTVTSRYPSQRRLRFPMTNYHPKTDGPKVPFFMDKEEMPGTPKADALFVFVPRDNPRALVVRPFEQWPSRPNLEKSTPSKGATTTVHENDAHASTNGNQKINGTHIADNEDSSHIAPNGHRANVEALIPKLSHSEYYTEPSIQDLAAKERANLGYCLHVKDFVVGRHGYGNIKFMGETDVTRLDLDSLIQFNNREVIVYMDESKKPPVGQGLNKPAEVALLNIKCFDKRTGKQYTEGPNIDKYKAMLKRKAEEQGAQFVSYEPVNGVWKFRVDHF